MAFTQPPGLFCPLCSASMRFMTQTSQDNELTTTFAHLSCSNCGLRSRDVISIEGQRGRLVAEWRQYVSRYRLVDALTKAFRWLGVGKRENEAAQKSLDMDKEMVRLVVEQVRLEKVAR